jgi:hypothetical protein
MNREDIIRMAKEAGLNDPRAVVHAYCELKLTGHLERFAALVAAAEREACAKVCEILGTEDDSFYAEFSRAKDCAEAIRARGQP